VLNPSPCCKMRPPLNSPRHPPPSPFASPQDRRKAIAELLAKLPPPCRRLRPISASSVNAASPFPSQYPPLTRAHLPDPLLDSILQRFNADVLDRRSPTPPPSPAASPPRCRKQSATRLTHSSSSRRAEHRPPLRYRGKPLEAHRSSPSVRLAGIPRRKPKLGEQPSSL
jgi:hypothetical protein